MNQSAILALAKESLGIRTAVRDTYLTAIIAGVVQELTDEKGVALVDNNANHLIFCVDYTVWRYQSRDSAAGMPRHLQFRLHNLMINSGGEPTP